MTNVDTDSVSAHRDAYENCQVLHRDISVRNVLILPNGKGMLNDWDMAKRKGTPSRDHERTVSLFLKKYQ
jgi:RIO-like serine/threonine protein kinase